MSNTGYLEEACRHGVLGEFACKKCNSGLGTIQIGNEKPQEITGMQVSDVDGVLRSTFDVDGVTMHTLFGVTIDPDSGNLQRARQLVEDMQSKLNLRTLQVEVSSWARLNFGKQPAYQPLLGVVEEVGELAHAELKAEQGIRGMDSPIVAQAARVDAVGDIIVFLLAYCAAVGIDLEDAVQTTWKEVQQRNWRLNPQTGGA